MQMQSIYRLSGTEDSSSRWISLLWGLMVAKAKAGGVQGGATDRGSGIGEEGVAERPKKMMTDPMKDDVACRDIEDEDVTASVLTEMLWTKTGLVVDLVEARGVEIILIVRAACRIAPEVALVEVERGRVENPLVITMTGEVKTEAERDHSNEEADPAVGRMLMLWMDTGSKEWLFTQEELIRHPWRDLSEAGIGTTAGAGAGETAR